MSEKRLSNVRIRGGKLIFRNFQGKATDYNAAGNRNFGVILDDELAEALRNDGWNVKYRKPKEDDPDQYQQPYLPVKVKYGKIPPIVTLIKNFEDGPVKMKLTEENVDQLDWSWIENADLVIRPYVYPAMHGKPSGISAYLKSLYVTVHVDEFEEKYANIPDVDERDQYVEEN